MLQLPTGSGGADGSRPLECPALAATPIVLQSEVQFRDLASVARGTRHAGRTRTGASVPPRLPVASVEDETQMGAFMIEDARLGQGGLAQ